MLSFSICIPIFKGSHRLNTAIESIFKQEGDIEYEIIIRDDNFPELRDEIQKTREIVSSYKDNRIRYYKNIVNLGSAKNIQKLSSQANKDILFFLCQDDILARDALIKTHNAFLYGEDIGAVTRPYFWFVDDIYRPVRVVKPYDEKENTVLSIFDGKKQFMKIFETLGQLSGLAYRRKYIDEPFGDECFTGHIYPFAGILCKHKCVILKDYTVAVLITDSQARNISSIYDLSPTFSWIKMYQTVFKDKRYEQVRKWGIEQMTKNYVGLVQIKNFSTTNNLIREILILLKYRCWNLFSIKFWFYSLISLLIPRFLLKRIVDGYKNNILSKIIRPNIRLKYLS